MDNDKVKISQYQSIAIYMIIFFSPCIRYIPSFTIKQAGNAAWLSIIGAMILAIIYLINWNAIMKKYESVSYVNILKDIMGKFLGSILVIIFFLWITLMISYNVRVYAERILSSTTPNIDMVLLVGIFFLASIYILRSGLVTIARMAEIFMMIILSVFILASILVLPKIDVTNFFPITYLDIVPSMKGSLGIIAIWSYISILFMYFDKVTVRKQYKKLNFKLYISLVVISLLIIIVPLGLFGKIVSLKMPVPFLNSIMEISFFDTIERIDAAIILLWVITDFMLTVVFIYSAMHLLKEHFKIQNVRPLLIIYLLFVFFLSLIISKSSFELTALSRNILTYINIIVGFAIPILVFIVGKIRKKL